MALSLTANLYLLAKLIVTGNLKIITISKDEKYNNNLFICNQNQDCSS